jgi:hypothetical protein
MPKERIDGLGGDFDTTVGWSPSQDLQVGVVRATPGSVLVDVCAGETAAAVGRTVRDWIAEHPDASDAQVGTRIVAAMDARIGGFDGLRTTLDRAGVNKLIRVLRRGRDSAFGRDE